MNKTKDELFQENLNCYGDNFEPKRRPSKSKPDKKGKKSSTATGFDAGETVDG